MKFVLDFWVQLGNWLEGVLSGWGVPVWGVNLIIDIVLAVILLVVGILAVIIFTPMERKVIARMQDRPGPNRVWPLGTLIAFADAIKMLTKEDIVPHKSDKGLHMLAALLVAMPAVLIFAVLPFGRGVIGQNLNVGILFILAIGSIHVLAILIAGWGPTTSFPSSQPSVSSTSSWPTKSPWCSAFWPWFSSPTPCQCRASSSVRPYPSSSSCPLPASSS